MRIIWSIFPKFYRHLSPEGLAELVRHVGLDTANVVVREGYWVTQEKLAVELPRFVKALRAAGIEPHFATTGFMPAGLLADPTPLAILADNGIRGYRMGHYQFRGLDVREALATARREMQQLAPLCLKHGVRCVFQLHHNLLIASATAGYDLVKGLPSEAVGIELDPGNQAFDGMENWERSARLLGEHLCALGVKDTALTQDPAEAHRPEKGWKRDWATLYEGVTNWHEVISALKGIDFSGTFVFMPFYNPDDPEEMTRKLKREVEYLRGIVAAASACPTG